MKNKNSSVIGSIISDVKGSGLFKLIRTSFTSWYTNWPWIILSVLVDLLFLVFVGTAMTLIQFTVFEHLEALMRLTGDMTGGLMSLTEDTMQMTSGITSVTGSSDFAYHLNVIFKYLGLFVLLSFLFWIVFQGISWYISHRIAAGKKRLPFLIFMKNFVLESVPFFFMSIFWIFISVRLTLSMRMSLTPVMSDGAINALFVLFMLVTWYFGALCYSLTSRYAFKNFRECFIYGIKRFPKVIRSYGFIILLFILIDLFLRLPFIRGDAFLLLVLGTVIFMPALAFARILLFNTAQMYWHDQPTHHTAKKK